MPATLDFELDRSDPRIGTTIKGKYHVDSVLGVGGMATVFAVTHRNKKRFAVKILHPEFSAREEIRSRFLREGYVANTVGHVGTVPVIDDDVDEHGAAFLVMDLCIGETVEAIAGKSAGRLPLDLVLRIAHQLLDVLSVAHEKRIVHRDIKPANLMLSPNGTLRVLDFGIARLLDGEDGRGVSATRSGVSMGTPAFMAPEQALGKISLVGPQTDVWAVGATMFNLLTGRFVHEGESAQETVVRAATMPAPSIASVATGIPADVARIVDRALAFECESRWDSALAMRDEVADAMHALGTDPPSLGERTLPQLSRADVISQGRTLIASDPATSATTRPGPVSPALPVSARTAIMAVAGTESHALTNADAAPRAQATRGARLGLLALLMLGTATVAIVGTLGLSRRAETNAPPTPQPVASGALARDVPERDRERSSGLERTGAEGLSPSSPPPATSAAPPPPRAQIVPTKPSTGVVPRPTAPAPPTPHTHSTTPATTASTPTSRSVYDP